MPSLPKLKKTDVLIHWIHLFNHSKSPYMHLKGILGESNAQHKTARVSETSFAPLTKWTQCDNTGNGGGGC